MKTNVSLPDMDANTHFNHAKTLLHPSAGSLAFQREEWGQTAEKFWKFTYYRSRHNLNPPFSGPKLSQSFIIVFVCVKLLLPTGRVQWPQLACETVPARRGHCTYLESTYMYTVSRRVHWKLYFTAYTVQCTLYAVRSILHTLHCPVYNIHCTLHILSQARPLSEHCTVQFTVLL